MERWQISGYWPSGSGSSAGGCARWRTGCSGFTVAHGRIVAIEVLADPERLSRLRDVAG
jgi:hypothetical protein